MISRPLSVILLDHSPRNTSRLVEHVDGRAGDALELLSRVRGIAQAVGIDDPVIRVGEQMEGDRTLTVSGDPFGEVPALFGLVHADGVQSHRLIRPQQRA